MVVDWVFELLFGEELGFIWNIFDSDKSKKNIFVVVSFWGLGLFVIVG